MGSQLSNLISDVVASPLGDVIANVGEGVAAAQRALDEASLAETLALYGGGDDERFALLREIGYRPTFYALPETTGEVNVSLRIANPQAANGAAPASSGLRLADRAGLRAAPRTRAYVTPVDAGFANQYGFSAQVSARLTFKIVPVPPPTGTEELRAVPTLIGRTLAEARTLLEGLDLVASPQGKDPKDEWVVTTSEPPASHVVRAGASIALSLEKK